LSTERLTDNLRRVADQIVIERNVPVPMRDGTVLRADVYRPAEGVHPVLVERTPYSKDVPIGLMVVLNPVKAAWRGYAVVVQDVRGRFESEGEFTPFVNEALDGYDTVEWAAAQPWSTGRVGMFGSSYMAATQLQAATAAPPHLQAIAPFEGSADYFEGRSYKGGAFELGALMSISLFALGPGVLQRAGLSGEEFRKIWRQIRAMLDSLPATAATAPLSDLRKTVLGDWAPFFFEWMEHDEPGPYWESFSVFPGHKNIRVPALHLSSWYDTYSIGAINNYLGIKAHGATPEAREHQYLWLGPWGHYFPRTVVNGAARFGEVDFGLNALIDLDSVQLAWFDRWLKDDTSGWRFKTPVRMFCLGANEWRDEAQWPVPAPVEALHLHGATKGGGRHHGLLSSAPPAASDAPDAYRADPAHPVPTVGGAHLMLESAFPQGPWDQRDIEGRDDVLLYTTPVLDEHVDVVGHVSLDIWIASTAPSTDVSASLTVVRPDGTSLNVLDGITRVTLTPGDATKVTVALGPVAQRFKQGERMRLRIAGSSFPRFDLNPQTGERSWEADHRVAADQTVLHDPEHSSVLHLPVAAGRLP
jgi:putative CocE/NonD family hydrolase